jgi:hypothetical protein
MQVTGVPAVVNEAVAIDDSSEVIEVDAESCGAVHFDDLGNARPTA